MPYPHYRAPHKGNQSLLVINPDQVAAALEDISPRRLDLATSGTVPLAPGYHGQGFNCENGRVKVTGSGLAILAVAGWFSLNLRAKLASDNAADSILFSTLTAGSQQGWRVLKRADRSVKFEYVFTDFYFVGFFASTLKMSVGEWTSIRLTYDKALDGMWCGVNEENAFESYGGQPVTQQSDAYLIGGDNAGLMRSPVHFDSVRLAGVVD